MGMRARALLVLVGVLAFVLDAYAQPAPATGRERARGATRAAGKPKPAPERTAYAAVPEAERIAIQSDLIWTGDYNGLANGDFGESSIAAVKAFQKRNGWRETGVLNPEERQSLAQAARARRQRVEWKVVEDRATGAWLGVPLKLAPQQRMTPTGARWQSGRGEIQIETFRASGPGVTLAQAFAQQKKEPPQRKVEYAVAHADFFVVSGLQNLKKFYVRAHVKNDEVRAVTVLYDQALEGIMDPIVVAISNTFQPFPAADDGGLGPKRRVEYASGFIASAAGHIVTEALAAEDCAYILVSGRGRADKLADDGGLALLRLYGARGLAPVPLASEAAPAGDIIVAGVADPHGQAGRDAVSTVTVQFAAGADGLAISPRPPAGFSGAPALDPAGRVAGLVSLRSPRVAGLASAGASAAALIPASAIKALLAKHGAAAPDGQIGRDAAKAGVVRVICVRD